MGLFSDCPGCAAKDEVSTTKDRHIAFLEGQVVALQKQLIEVASPGANARIAYQPPPAREKAEGPGRVHSPARIERVRSTRPEPVPPEQARLAAVSAKARDIEGEFTRSDP